jgi:LPS-assembly protein
MEVDGYATLKHGFFYVKGVPIFYLPYFIYPAKRNRQTGFLTPTVSNSTLKGLDIKFPFFVNMSPSVDATLTPRICTRRALQTALEFRYFPFIKTKGRFYGEYTYDWSFSDEGGPKNHRFFLNWSHSQTLPIGMNLKAYGNWLSDRDYFEFWAGKLDKRKRVRYLESAMMVNRQWNDFMFQAEARYFDDLSVSDNALTRQHLPIVSATAFNQKIPYTPLYFSSDIDYGHFYTPMALDTWIGSRIKMNSTLRLPLSLGGFVKFEPSATFLPKAYSANYVNERGDMEKGVESIRTDLYQIDARAYTDLSSVYGGSFLGFQRIKHSMRPSVSWIFRPPSKAEDYPVFDDSDKVEKVSLITAELDQTLTGKLGEGEYLDFFTLTLSQGYDFYTTRTAEDPLGTRAAPLVRLTNTRAGISLKPHSLIDFSAKGEYDLGLNRANKYILDLGLMDHRGDLLKIEHQYTESSPTQTPVRQTNLSLQARVTSDLTCFFQNQYSHSFDFSYFTSIGMSYQPQCWSMALRYSEAREKDPITNMIKTPEQTVFLTVAIGELGQVYSMTRDLGELADQWGVFSSETDQ